MSKSGSKFTRMMLGASLISFIIATSTYSAAQDAPIILPGAPGEGVQTLTAADASTVAANSYSPDDVTFMQNMIPHHAQAVEMAALVEDRTNNPDLISVAGRIDRSQADEIEFMEDWLRERNEPVKNTYGSGHEGHEGHMMMAGMATPEQMKELAGVEGTDFDKMFLELMITHHDGALIMVDDLKDQPGSAYDPVLFEFINDIVSDQSEEIDRMSGLLSSLSGDDRVGLAAGFTDAGEAAWNARLETALPNPPGFFDPENPSGMRPKKAKRSPLLSFTNTDMAFAGDILVTGSYHGFNIYKLDDEGLPDLHSSVVCPGGQGDVSIVDDLLIMSVEQTRGRVDCGRQGVAEGAGEERFRGIRIFDISDLAKPVQVGQVQTCRGSHTHSIVSSDEEKVIVYNSGTSYVRDESELEGCIGNVAGDERSALFRIDVIEIPLSDPSKARIIDSPKVFSDDETGQMAGLWRGGRHGDGTQYSSRTDQCHDITVFPDANIAAGACSGNGVIFDISNPMKPKRIDAVVDTGFAYWHSATFNNDGTKVIFTDEWGGGGRPRCRVYDPKDWGANAVYDIVDGKLEFKSYYKLPAPQTDTENCVAHNGSVVPVPGRDIFAQAWYQGGLSVIDFTDSTAPIEIAYFDRGPYDADKLTLAGYWSTYWYDGKIYGTEIKRGLDVISLLPSDYLSENEIKAASLANQGNVFNPQQQFPVTWPAEPVVARAYLDQMKRAGILSDIASEELLTTLSAAESSFQGDKANPALASKLKELAESFEGSSNSSQAGLYNTLQEMALRLE